MKNMTRKNKIILLIIAIIVIFCSIALELTYLLSDNNHYNHNDETIDYSAENYETINSFNLAQHALNVNDDASPTIIFGSDYQGENRYTSLKKILDKNYNSINPNLYVFCGDYQETNSDNYSQTEYGIVELYTLVTNYYSDSIPKLFIQGNHDLKQAHGIADSGIYESDKYIIYVINTDEFPNNQNQIYGSKSIVKSTAKQLKDDLQSMVNNGKSKPVFVSTHVPLHYSDRNHGGDNKYAKYIIDVLNEYGDKLDIVYLFGHNHSGKYDDYLGGSINYVAKGSNIKEGGTNQDIKINFTYMNAGYMGNSKNSLTNNTVNYTSISAITVNDNNLSIQKYTKHGNYYEHPIIVKLKNK